MKSAGMRACAYRGSIPSRSSWSGCHLLVNSAIQAIHATYASALRKCDDDSIDQHAAPTTFCTASKVRVLKGRNSLKACNAVHQRYRNNVVLHIQRLLVTLIQ